MKHDPKGSHKAAQRGTPLDSIAIEAALATGNYAAALQLAQKKPGPALTPPTSLAIAERVALLRCDPAVIKVGAGTCALYLAAWIYALMQ